MEPLDFTLKTITQAGELMLRGMSAGFTVAQKGEDPRDLVTSTDTDINAFVMNALKEAFPTDGIYSEEAHGDDLKKERLWVIDPIDGTANFSRGIPHFSTCIGLLERGIPIVGAVYNPITRELFHFQKGKGAFLNGQPIHVSMITDLKDAHTFFHAGRKQELRDWGGESYRRLLGAAKKTENFASSALDICFVAAGRIEANIYGTLSTLDCAPALGILAEAGGIASDRNGETLKLLSGSQMVFTANNTTLLNDVRTLLLS